MMLAGKRRRRRQKDPVDVAVDAYVKARSAARYYKRSAATFWRKVRTESADRVRNAAYAEGCDQAAAAAAEKLRQTRQALAEALRLTCPPAEREGRA